MPRLLKVVLALCAMSPVYPMQQFAATELVLLTQSGCATTTRMRSNLDKALLSISLPAKYKLIDIDSLEQTDPRRAYGSPTLFYKNVDLFGMKPSAQPTSPS